MVTRLLWVSTSWGLGLSEALRTARVKRGNGQTPAGLAGLGQERAGRHAHREDAILRALLGTGMMLGASLGESLGPRCSQSTPPGNPIPLPHTSSFLGGRERESALPGSPVRDKWYPPGPSYLLPIYPAVMVSLPLNLAGRH